MHLDWAILSALGANAVAIRHWRMLDGDDDNAQCDRSGIFAQKVSGSWNVCVSDVLCVRHGNWLGRFGAG